MPLSDEVGDQRVCKWGVEGFRIHPFPDCCPQRHLRWEFSPNHRLNLGSAQFCIPFAGAHGALQAQGATFADFRLP